MGAPQTTFHSTDFPTRGPNARAISPSPPTDRISITSVLLSIPGVHGAI